MSGDTTQWLTFAEENYQVALLSHQHGLNNACIQNAQQAVEKALKAMCLACGLGLTKTHSIDELAGKLRAAGVALPLSDDDCDLFDSAYLPTKYPLGALLPDFSPDAETAQDCLLLAEKVLTAARHPSGESAPSFPTG